MLKIIIMTFLFTTLSFAKCYERLTNGFQDSALFTQHSSVVFSNGSESLDEQMAYNAISKTLSDLGCSDKINLDHIKCADVLDTTMCRLNSKYGYFLVLKDYVDTVNIIFNRWD